VSDLTSIRGLQHQPLRAPSLREQMVDWYSAGMTVLMIDLGHRVGLFEAAVGTGPLTSGQLADRAGCDERYVREWLGAMVTAGVFRYEPGDRTYELPAEQASFVTGTGPRNGAPSAAALAAFARLVEPVADHVCHGGGIPHEAFAPAFTEVMDALARARYDSALVSEYLSIAPTAVCGLRAGIRVADIGCGTGHTTNLMAQAFPRSTFLGYDLATNALQRAVSETTAMGLTNVAFVAADVLDVPTEPPFDLICAFDCIHEQVDPAGVLSWVAAALAPGGTFLMVDVNASSRLEDNIGRGMAPSLYARSVLHCLPVSLAHGGAGLGAMWGHERAREMLAHAGFGEVLVHEIAADPVSLVYVARR
jgi:SAM-dependent methyltransferase